MEDWWFEAVQLLEEGQGAAAVSVVRRAAMAGSLAARARLAVFQEDADLSRGQANALVDGLSNQVSPGDATANWVLWHAYELGMGRGGYRRKLGRRFKHARAYAVATGDPQAAAWVAGELAYGNPGVQQDMQDAVNWYHCAGALGDPDALRDMAYVLRRLKELPQMLQSSTRPEHDA